MVLRRTVVLSPCRAGSCARVVASRGLCLAHYQQAQNLVRKGRTTWAALEEAGLALPPGASAGRLGKAWLAPVLRPPAPKAPPVADAPATPPAAPPPAWPFA
jgi:hypothetical protein